MGYYTYAFFYSETFSKIDFQLRPYLSYAYSFSPFQDNINDSHDPPFSYQYDNQGHIRLLRMWFPHADSKVEHPSFVLPIIGDFDQDGHYDFAVIYTWEDSVEYLPEGKIYLQKDGRGFRYIGGVRLFEWRYS